MTIARSWLSIAATLLLTGGLLLAASWPAREPGWSRLPRGPLLEQARDCGVLVVAVRAYPRPAPPGSPAPPEPDDYDASLARYIARTLGVPARIVNLPAPDAKPGPLGRLMPQADLIIAGARADLPAAPRPDQVVATAYLTGPAALVALRGTASSPAGHSVCMQQGSPYANGLAAARGARLQAYASSVHAAYAFMSGECDILAEDELVLKRLMAREEWRFYQRLPVRMEADRATPQIVLDRPDAASARYLDRVVRYWQASGAQEKARERRAGEVNFEVATLQDGMVCHS